MSLMIAISGLLLGLVCIGGFMWSAMEQKPKAIWLLGAGIALIVGLAGLIFRGSL